MRPNQQRGQHRQQQPAPPAPPQGGPNQGGGGQPRRQKKKIKTEWIVYPLIAIIILGVAIWIANDKDKDDWPDRPAATGITVEY